VELILGAVALFVIVEIVKMLLDFIRYMKMRAMCGDVACHRLTVVCALERNSEQDPRTTLEPDLFSQSETASYPSAFLTQYEPE